VRAHYVIVSPLTSKDIPSNIAPFGAVPRCGRAIGDEYNMMLEQFELELSWPANVTKNKPAFPAMAKGLPRIVASVQGMRNSRKLNKDEVLCLPFFHALPRDKT